MGFLPMNRKTHINWEAQLLMYYIINKEIKNEGAEKLILFDI